MTSWTPQSDQPAPDLSRAIELALRQIIARELKTDVEGVLPAERLKNLMIDSLSMVEIIMALEEDFGIDVDDSQLAALNPAEDTMTLVPNGFTVDTVSDLARFIEAKIRATPRGSLTPEQMENLSVLASMSQGASSGELLADGFASDIEEVIGDDDDV